MGWRRFETFNIFVFDRVEDAGPGRSPRSGFLGGGLAKCLLSWCSLVQNQDSRELAKSSWIRLRRFGPFIYCLVFLFEFINLS